MRIAQVTTLFSSVPPSRYGGTERLVAYLTEELVRQGHEVTLFASGDSRTKARLIPGCECSLNQDQKTKDWVAFHILMAEKAVQLSSEYDVVHNHMEYLLFPASRRLKAPMVTTTHWCLEDRKREWGALYEEFSELPLVSISDAQRRSIPRANWRATVYHGLPEDLYTFREGPGKYLTFLGRIAPEKGVRDAIDIAARSGLPLRIAGNFLDSTFYKQMRPWLKHPLVEYLGEVNDQEKDEILGGASALILPVHWEEPFGLVMIEALACGTPVIARRRGSVPEVIEEGVTGFMFEETEEAVRATERIQRLSRARCRQVFEERFTAGRMAREYVTVYEKLLKRNAREAAGNE